jgi:hypothetical protein
MRTGTKVRLGICALWFLAAGAGIAMIANYQYVPGTAGPAPEVWPAGTHIARYRDRATLLMFVHPRCPCTRASLEELNRLLAKCSGRAVVDVLFFRPRGLPEDWARTDSWRTAASIPGVSAREDPDGAIARKFGAETSGYVLLYDAAGRLVFRGGITDGRGHTGDNAGATAVTALLLDRPAGTASARVYGCPLLGRSCSVPGAPK